MPDTFARVNLVALTSMRTLWISESVNEHGTRDVAGVRIPPPVIFIGFLGVGLTMHFVLPISFKIPFGYRLALALSVLLPSGCLALGAYKGMHQKDTPFDPAKPTVAICCEGVFRISRNPMYLALVLLLTGIGFAMASPYLLMLSPLLLLVLDRMAVRPEEAYLTRKFGDAYLDYKRKVRRWL